MSSESALEAAVAITPPSSPCSCEGQSGGGTPALCTGEVGGVTESRHPARLSQNPTVTLGLTPTAAVAHAERERGEPTPSASKRRALALTLFGSGEQSCQMPDDLRLGS